MGDHITSKGGIVVNNSEDTKFDNVDITYTEGTDTSQQAEIKKHLEQLIQLLQTSKDLPETDKKDATEAIQAVADQVKEDKVNKLSVKGILIATQELITKAADVAGPGAAIIATVAKLMGLV